MFVEVLLCCLHNRSFRITYQVPDSLFALPHYFGDFIPRQCPLPSQGGFFGDTTRYQIPLRRSQLPKVDILWVCLVGFEPQLCKKRRQVEYSHAISARRGLMLEISDFQLAYSGGRTLLCAISRVLILGASDAAT